MKMKKDLYIIGAGGFAKEVGFLIKEINQSSLDNEKYLLKGFIDIRNIGESIILGKEKYTILSEDNFVSGSVNRSAHMVIGTANPIFVKKIIEKFGDRYDFPNLIHPNVIGDFEHIAMGKGNIIAAGCIFTTSIKIDSYNIINIGSTIAHDVEIGSFNIINPRTNISGGVRVGDSNIFGTNSTVIQYLEVGENTTIGAGAVITRSIEDNSIMLGNPAKLFMKKAK